VNLNYREVNEGVLFTQDPVTSIDSDTVEYLKAKALGTSSKSIRLCFHLDTREPVQEMLIVHSRDGYIRPHRHDHGASYHVVDGQLDVVMFDNAGQVTGVVRMGEYASGMNFYWRISAKTFYTLIPRSDPVVFHETLNGPFDPITSTEWAEWAPHIDQEVEIERFMTQLERDASGMIDCDTGDVI
jgi:cupin fold WbuC family metalloprotein